MIKQGQGLGLVKHMMGFQGRVDMMKQGKCAQVGTLAYLVV
jgi:hypothetical protein